MAPTCVEAETLVLQQVNDDLVDVWQQVREVLKVWRPSAQQKRSPGLLMTRTMIFATLLHNPACAQRFGKSTVEVQHFSYPRDLCNSHQTSCHMSALFFSHHLKHLCACVGAGEGQG